MNTRDFERFRENFTDRRQMMADGKALSYASDADRLQNFKRQAARWGVDPMVVLGVYLGKHMDSIEAFIRDGIEGPEGVEGNVSDAMNYLDLLAAMLHEIRTEDVEARR